MPSQEIRRWLRRQPFQPFRIYILEQTVYEVHHPELVVLQLATLDYFLPSQQEPIPIAGQQITIALRHITKLEELPRTTSDVSGNGEIV